MSLISKTVESYRTRFSSRIEPRIFQAPGRVNLIGDHTDYNDGFVLPAAIDRRIVIAATPRADSLVNIFALDFDQWDHFDLNGELTRRSENSWGNYIRGIAWSLRREGFWALTANCTWHPGPVSPRAIAFLRAMKFRSGQHAMAL